MEGEGRMVDGFAAELVAGERRYRYLDRKSVV